MPDFSLDIYRELLESLQEQGYALVTYSDYCKKYHSSKRRDKKFVILRHDIDARPENSLAVAQIEHSLGATATYYFRKVEPEIIRTIVSLGHEIGYHYEDLSRCEGEETKAWSSFQVWLDYFRRFYAVETVCAHGAPYSRWDNKELLKKHDYKALGIVGEPYLDTDFSDVLYLTDTGRCWDGYKVSRRDKIPLYQDEWTQNGWSWHTTQQLIQAVKNGQMPAHVLLTTHPQRWTNNKLLWWRELILQNCKNMVKRLMI